MKRNEKKTQHWKNTENRKEKKLLNLISTQLFSISKKQRSTLFVKWFSIVLTTTVTLYIAWKLLYGCDFIFQCCRYCMLLSYVSYTFSTIFFALLLFSFSFHFYWDKFVYIHSTLFCTCGIYRIRFMRYKMIAYEMKEIQS